MAEPRPASLTKDPTTLYRLEQLERQQHSINDTLKMLVDRIGAMDARQQVHMKQTEMAQQTNDDKMEEVVDKVDALTNQVSTQTVDSVKAIAGLQVTQTFLEKYGPAAGTSAAVSGFVSIVLGAISQLIGSGE